MNLTPTDIPDEQVTRLRILKEDGEWFLDGTDGRGNYSTTCWSYDTFAAAWSDVADFAATFEGVWAAIKANA